jgi:SAM-dependent methyltransferase
MEQQRHDEHARARSFGAVAELYDRARPSYPSEMVRDLLAGGPADILDVGCGTGKVACLFVGPGRRVLGVEPDRRMAAVARGHGIDIEVGTFET